LDGDIVLVKCVNELLDGDIGIFIIKGDIMCKRYTKSEKSVILDSNNSSEMWRCGRFLGVPKNQKILILGNGVI